MPAVWWPSPSDYQDTVQNPRSAFSDPALRDGTVVRDALGLPKPISGSFATVYQVDYAGRRYAVRCFLRHVPDIAQRYAAISAYLKQVSLPHTVEFHFLPQGIRLRDQWFPILKMDWLEGERLDVYVARHLNDGPALLQLTRQFVEFAFALRRAKIAHGDLQHGNLLIVNHRLRLLDYDGMFVPSLSGRASNEVGQPNYQHPIRSARDYGPHLDNFSVWVIALSLLALAVEPSLRSGFSAGSEALLLERSDFINPSGSKTLTALQQSSNPTLRELTLAFVPYLFARDLNSIPALEPGALAQVQAPTAAPPNLPDWLRDRVPPVPAPLPAPVTAPSSASGADWLLDHLESASPNRLSGSFRAEKSLLALVSLLFVSLVAVMSMGPVPPLVGLAIVILPVFAVLTLSFGFSLRYNSADRRNAVRSVQDLQKAVTDLRGRENALLQDLSGMERAEQDEMALLIRQQSANVKQEKVGLAALDRSLETEMAKIAARRKALDEKKDALLADALEQLQQEQMERKLETYRISDALLPGISRELKQILARHGFQTAADITNFHVNVLKAGKRFNLVNRRGIPVYVEGVSPERGVALILWRRTVEARVKSALPTKLPPDTANRLGKRFQDEVVNLKLAELKSKQQIEKSRAELGEKTRKEHERLTRVMQELPATYRSKLQAKEQELLQVRKAIAEREWALVLARRHLQTFAHINFFNYVRSIFGL